MCKIKYLSYYAPHNDVQNRSSVLSATNKMDYICHAINENRYDVEIISASGTLDKKHCYKGYKKQLNEKTCLKMFFAFPWRNKVTRLLQYIWIRMCLSAEILKLRKDDKIIVYHSLAYMNLIRFFKKIKNFNLILEVEEIYSDVIGNKKMRKKEIEYFKCADSYIFPTIMLNEKLNTENKKYCIIHGTYQVEPDRNSKRNDNRIHIVYAGTFDPRKGGVMAAVTAAEHLDSHYHIHILGFGTETEKKNLLNEIDNVSKKSECIVTYDGLKSGEDYINFLQSCDIGLSTQNPDAEFNDTSFPSKILSYMANGLRVVSIRIPAIESSDIDEYMYYYDEQTPQAIAEAVMEIDLNDGYDGRKRIEELDNKFQVDVKGILEV